jgi:DNA-binding response OmpR family regulator
MPRRTLDRGETKVVLVVQEKPTARADLVDYFQALGFIAIPAADVESADVIIRKLPVDLIVLAVPPDDLTAVALVSDVKRRRPGTRILMLSSEPATVRTLFESAGVDDIAPLPVPLPEFEHRVRSLLKASWRGGRTASARPLITVPAPPDGGGSPSSLLSPPTRPKR